MPRRESNNGFPHILYSCYAHRSSEGEQFVSEHVFAHVISGSSEIFVGGKNFTFKEGDYRFFSKNQLTRYTKYPPAGGEYKSISIRMDKDLLQGMSEELNLHPAGPYTGDGTLRLEANPLYKNYIESLTPYLDDASNETLTMLKVKEAVMILLQTHPALKDVLFDFSEPGKIDLEAYMNEHYKFNVHLDRFAYLTGRSLATFKRDFEKAFHMSPSRWLQKKRLGEAYYLIREKGRKASDVYVEVGFEDLSHFSFAFKKTYGVAPSLLPVAE